MSNTESSDAFTAWWLQHKEVSSGNMDEKRRIWEAGGEWMREQCAKECDNARIIDGGFHYMHTTGWNEASKWLASRIRGETGETSKTSKTVEIEFPDAIGGGE